MSAARVLRWLAVLFTLALAALGIQHLRLSPDTKMPGAPAAGLRVATWNVHYILTDQPKGRWGLSGWQARRGPLDAAFKMLDADILAFQEMESFAGGDDDSVNLARSWLLDRNPGYAAAAIGDWRRFPSTQPIFYRTARLDQLDQGWFFFSDTPEIIYSRSFDGRYPAFASWARFRDVETRNVLRVVNVHFDAGSRHNRRRSAALVARRVAPWVADGEAVVLAGDLNALHGSHVHDVLSRAGLNIARVPGATFHLDRGLNLLPAIDFIGVSPVIAVRAGPRVFAGRAGSLWPADHYPVWMDLSLDRLKPP